MKLAALVAVFLLSSSFVAPAFAQTDRRARQPAPKEIIFGEEDLIEGTLQRPDGDDITLRKGAKFESLLRLRKDFADKLMHSASSL